MPSISPVLFLLASATCLVAGALAWALLKLAERLWPGIAAQRAVWLLAQLAVAVTFVLALLPRSAEISVVPAIELSPAERSGPLQASAVPGVLGPIGRDALDSAAGDSELDGAPVNAMPRWLSLLSLAWLAVYGAGLLYAAGSWARAQRALRALLRTADRVSSAALNTRQGFAEVSPYRGPPVLETPVPVSPMLVGLRTPRLLLPSHLSQFDAQQQQLIVAHELTHWRRRDHVWLHASLLLQTLFWFNPAVRLMRAKMNWAQELACDQQVLAGRPVQQRQSYAAALVAQLKLQEAMVSSGYSASAFGGAGLAAVSERIRLIRDGGAGVLGAAGKTLLGGATVALLAASVLLQPAFAWRAADAGGQAGDGGGSITVPPDVGVGAAVADAAGVAGAARAETAAPAATADALPSWRSPLDVARVSSFYGPRSKPLASSNAFHRGIDFAAHRGTPVLAPAAGKVVESTALYDGQAKYGQVLVIDHGNGLRSMYAHLDRRSVRVGDAVAAGQQIGLSGATGRVTGPHLHLEVQRDGAHVDPARLIANLDASAFPSALRARSAALAN
ncbi:M23/M56 family metallopeptidase [Massilia sp. Root418]|uniref:M23/M56 family metallopeptidase n=1 Tax=Massilia sp. Root418 TaxID=1736532 RepID=UPI0009EBB269|nr:M23/M56 family metallopeptidase [Massilia sp. Root418]